MTLSAVSAAAQFVELARPVAPSRSAATSARSKRQRELVGAQLEAGPAWSSGSRSPRRAGRQAIERRFGERAREQVVDRASVRPWLCTYSCGERAVARLALARSSAGREHARAVAARERIARAVAAQHLRATSSRVSAASTRWRIARPGEQRVVVRVKAVVRRERLRLGERSARADESAAMRCAERLLGAARQLGRVELARQRPAAVRVAHTPRSIRCCASSMHSRGLPRAIA